MTKQDNFIEFNKLEKLNRRNRLEDKLKQQEYYGDREELFDPLTKTLNANNERNLALGEQTLRAIDWQNQKLDKQTKMIQQAGSQFNEALMKSNEAVEDAQEEPRIIGDKDTAQITNFMTNQSNPQLKIFFGSLAVGEFDTTVVKLTYQKKCIYG